MAYMSNPAPKRVSREGISPAGPIGTASNQAKSIGQTSKFKNPDTSKAASNQVKFLSNGKGTGTFGRPSDMGVNKPKHTTPTAY